MSSSQKMKQSSDRDRSKPTFRRRNSMSSSKTKYHDQKPTVYYDAICVTCNEPTKVPFKPDGVRPVYCKECYKSIKETRT